MQPLCRAELLMGPHWMLLMVVLGCSEAQTVMEVPVELGQDANLTCSVYLENTQWFMEIHNELRAAIGRSFASASSTFSSPDFEAKYLIHGNRLLVRNVSAEDLRLYYCGKTLINGTTVYGDAFRLVPVTGSPSPNTTAAAAPTGPAWRRFLPPSLVIASFSLNLLLILALVVLTCAYLRRSGCCGRRRAKEPAEEPRGSQEGLNAQYEEIQHRPQLSSECIYYKAQLPGCRPQV